ncbi:IS701 family transposase, partial [Desulfobulbus sp. F4]|nr:IS701 family transposase [Desulfobulbus sp. F4]
MNKAEVTDCDYIDFLIGTQRICSCTEAERVQPDETGGPPHDAFTRHLPRHFPGVDRLWAEVREHADLTGGCL